MTNKVRKPNDPGPNQQSNVATLSEDELNAVSAGMRKSAGGNASGVMFLAFTFKL